MLMLLIVLMAFLLLTYAVRGRPVSGRREYSLKEAHGPYAGGLGEGTSSVTGVQSWAPRLAKRQGYTTASLAP